MSWLNNHTGSARAIAVVALGGLGLSACATSQCVDERIAMMNSRIDQTDARVTSRPARRSRQPGSKGRYRCTHRQPAHRPARRTCRHDGTRSHPHAENSPKKERCKQRPASLDAEDNRITHGCINVAQTF
jgi:hypothetical protein